MICIVQEDMQLVYTLVEVKVTNEIKFW